MEYTGYDTVSSTAISGTSNKYLEEIETWNETDLPYYKKKVRSKIFSEYTSIVAGVIVINVAYILLTAIIYSAFSGLANLLDESKTAALIFTGVFALAVFLVVFFFSKKSAVEFIDSCHGEIARKKSPFIRKVTVHLIISIILCIAVVGGVSYYAMTTLNSGADLLELTRNAVAMFAPVAYFSGIIVARNSVNQCPVCGRLNTIYKIKIGEDFGERKDGSHKEYEHRSERVGTKTITTYYTDGSTTSRDEGIYESVRYTKEYDDYSNLSKHEYLCHECSYAEETVEELKWKIFKTKYRG